MQSWKRQYRQNQPASQNKWLRPALAIFFLVITLVAAVFDFPAHWNKSVVWAGNLTGLDVSFAKMDETGYRLGLDLQGGTHLIYEADLSGLAETEQTAALDGVRDVIERRVNAFGVSEPLVAVSGSNRLVVDLAGVLNVSEAIKQIGETPILEFKEENTDVGRAATVEEQQEIDAANVAERQQADDILSRAKNGEWEALKTEFSVEDLGWFSKDNSAYGFLVQAVLNSWLQPDSIVPKVVEGGGGLSVARFIEKKESKKMELSHILICFEGKTGCENPIPAIEANIKLIQLRQNLTVENFAEKAGEYSTDPGSKDEGGYLGWIEPGQTVPAFETAALNTLVNGFSETVETEYGYHIIYKRAEAPITVYHLERILVDLTDLNNIAQVAEPWKSTGLTGQHLRSARVEFDPNTGVPYVSLQFDGEGANLFADITERNLGKYVAIFLDGSPISIPVVQDKIYGGQAIISGRFTLEEAKLLAQRLNAGALPVPIHLISQQTVGPILGQLSLDKSIAASLVGFGLVVFFMLFVYRLPGLLAIMALMLYAFLNMACYRIFGVTISLSGIAGLVLSIGMAVDANVLIFERIKEEMRAGRDLRSATDEGFRRAWPAIRDGNITTLIAAFVLYGFSSSFVKGFALTLAVGICISMFTAIVVTRAYLLFVQGFEKLRDYKLYFSPPKSS